MPKKSTTAAVAAAGVVALAGTVALVTTSTSPPAERPPYCYHAGSGNCRSLEELGRSSCPLGMVAVWNCPPPGEVPTPVGPPPTQVPPTPTSTPSPIAAPTPPPPIPTIVIPPISGGPLPMPTPGGAIPPISGEPPFTFPLPCAQTPQAYRLEWILDRSDWYFLDVVPGGRGALIETDDGAMLRVGHPGIKSVPLNLSRWIAVTGAASAWVRNSQGTIVYPAQPVTLQPCY